MSDSSTDDGSGGGGGAREPQQFQVTTQLAAGNQYTYDHQWLTYFAGLDLPANVGNVDPSLHAGDGGTAYA